METPASDRRLGRYRQRALVRFDEQDADNDIRICGFFSMIVNDQRSAQPMIAGYQNWKHRRRWWNFARMAADRHAE